MSDLMRRAAVVAGAALVVLGLAVGVASAAAGAGAPNQPAYFQWTSVSCASAGDCSAGGDYADSSGHQQVFVVTEKQGIWGRAVEVPGSAALNRGGNAVIISVSCASAGNCSAGGDYADGSGHQQVFVVSEVHGIWRRAIEVPGSAALNRGGNAAIAMVSCASAGNCSAGGNYADSDGNAQAFLVNEVHGIWGKAVEVPGTAALNVGGDAGIASVSCAAPGYCSAGGSYAFDTVSHLYAHAQAFVVSEARGIWGRAVEVPGSAALNREGNAGIASVSCASAGNCSAGGSYADSSGGQAFVVSQEHGVWGKALAVTGSRALNRGGNAEIFSVSCASAGYCSASGTYADSSRHQQVFVVSQVHGTWGRAIEVPGTAALNGGGYDVIFSVSCGSAGYCSAGGFYTDGSGHQQVFVVSQVRGTWGRAIEAPGTAALNGGGLAQIDGVSCARGGDCSAAGLYSDSSRHGHVLVVGEVHGMWARAREVPAPPP
jgi:hypothetical protein